MRKLLITAALFILAFAVPGFLGTLFGIAGGVTATAFVLTAPRAQRMLKWGAGKYVEDDARREKVKEWVNTDSN